MAWAGRHTCWGEQLAQGPSFVGSHVHIPATLEGARQTRLGLEAAYALGVVLTNAKIDPKHAVVFVLLEVPRVAGLGGGGASTNALGRMVHPSSSRRRLTVLATAWLPGVSL